jgi:hypothetical protein
MRENCSDEWEACEADSDCNTCGQCLDGPSANFASCLIDGDCGNVAQQPVTDAMIQCACGADTPCAEVCCL